MMPQTIKYKGNEQGAYRRIMAGTMPPLPRPDRRGNVPAVEYARASFPREIIARRLGASLTQAELARTERGVRDPFARASDGPCAGVAR